MKKLAGLILVASMGLGMGGCALSPGGVSADGHVVIAKNVGFLFGLLNKIYVCNVTPAGVTNCAAGDSP